MSNTDLVTYEKKILGLFKEKTPAKNIKHRPGAGGMSFAYVEVGYVVNKLNETFTPLGWDWKVTDKGIGKKQVWVQGDLIIKFPGTDYTVTRSGFGGAPIKCFKGTDDPVDIANDLKGASSAALKKAASLLGIAADVYYKEQDWYDNSEDEVEKPTDEDLRSSVNRRLFAVAAEKGYNEQDIDKVIKRDFNLDSKKDLSVQQMRELITRMENHPKPMPKVEEAVVEVKAEEPPVIDGQIVNKEEVDVEKIADTVFSDTPGLPKCRQCEKEFDPNAEKRNTDSQYFCSIECQDKYYPPKKTIGGYRAY